ncbi:MAG: DUF1549 domain-containing protein, partial [Opitutae bacterium]|nr:DUF1549 domain-containing protein [Opitutae bacterium]
KAGLDMTTLEGMLLGGDSGPSLIPGDLDNSLIIEAVRYRNEDMSMPPKKPLSTEKVKILEEWVSSGAPWPGFEGELVVGKEGSEEPYDWDKFRREHWSFQPVIKPVAPATGKSEWPKVDLDHFILAKLKSKGLKPNAQAEKRILLRRAYLDLLGLVPKPDEVRAFMNDDSPDAFTKLVDRLLDSKHYGERWARHWLDVARYSDGLGGFGDGQDLPGAWRYRDWVVKAFNEDMPFNEFARRQIAGDCLEDESKDPVATGFFAIGPTYKGDGGDAEATNAAKAETLSDRVDTFSRAFLGLTAACARCHNHKFDPISIKDYYSLAGIFNNSRLNLNHPLGTKDEIDAHKEGNARVKEKQEELNAWSVEVREDGMRKLMRQSGDHILALYRYYQQRNKDGGISDRNKYATEKGIEPKSLNQWERVLKDARNKGKFPLLATWFEKSPLDEKTKAIEAELTDSAKVFRERIVTILDDLDGRDSMWREDMKTQGKRLPRPRASKEDLTFLNHLRGGPCKIGNPDELGDKFKEKHKAMRDAVALARKEVPPKPPTAHVLNEGGSTDMHVALRGDLAKKGEVVPRRFLRVLAGDDSPIYKNGSGRKELAIAVTDSSNPLTARVIVNRVWQWHFGQAIVGTPSNFGILGEKPSHPKLLDWLASSFVEEGWSLKKFHRKILLSATWQMSSVHDDAKFAKDGDNRFLWRMNPRKLDAENWRDSLLVASGELDFTIGGSPITNILTSPRRTLYSKISRSGDRFDSDAFLRLFGFPAPQSTSAKRAVSTVPQQYLFMMNSSFMQKRAQALTQTLQQEKD